MPRPRCSAPPDRSQSGPDYTGIRTSLLTTRNPGDDPQQSWGEPTGSRGEAGFLARVCTSNHVFLIRMLIKVVGETCSVLLEEIYLQSCPCLSKVLFRAQQVPAEITLGTRRPGGPAVAQPLATPAETPSL